MTFAAICVVVACSLLIVSGIGLIFIELFVIGPWDGEL